MTFPDLASSRFDCFAGECFLADFSVGRASRALESLTRLAPVAVLDSATLGTSFGVEAAAVTADISNPLKTGLTETGHYRLRNVVPIQCLSSCATAHKPNLLMAINRKKHAVPDVTVSPSALPPGHVRVAPIHALGELIRLLGGDSDAVFRSAKIDERDLADRDYVLPIAFQGELLARGAQATRCEHFGLLLGDRSGISQLGAVSELMLNRASVGEALDVFSTFWLRHTTATVVFIGRSGDQATLGFAAMDGNMPGMTQLQDGAMAMARNIMRGILGADWCPTGVTLMRREPRDPEFYANFFGAPCRFNATRSELIFPATTLDFSLKNSAAGSTDVVQYPFDSHDLGACVQRVAYRLLLQGECSRKRVAAALGVSSRTLVRKLASSGVTYQELFEGARYSVSRSLIRETNLTLAEIAAALGYNEASSFTRAFQRWSGISPARWRTLKVEPAWLKLDANI